MSSLFCIETCKSTSSSNGSITSASFGWFAADSGRGSVLKAVLAESTLIIDESIVISLLLLPESPVVKECRSNSNVHARTRESTNDEKESATFLEIAPGAYMTDDFVHDVSDPKVCAAFCSTCAAFADASAALLNTDASMWGFSPPPLLLLLPLQPGAMASCSPTEKCSPTFGRTGRDVVPSSSVLRMSKDGTEQMTAW